MGRKKKIIDGVMRLQLQYKRRRGETSLFALIDESNWKLAAIRWHALRTSTGQFYAYCNVLISRGKHRPVYLHREVMAA